MENYASLTPEELAKLVEEAEKQAKAALDKMTPEEREQSIARANKLIAEDQARLQKIVDEAKAVANGNYSKGNESEPESAEKKTARFCSNCGAPAGSGKFCEYCGKPL